MLNTRLDLSLALRGSALHWPVGYVSFFVKSLSMLKQMYPSPENILSTTLAKCFRLVYDYYRDSKHPMLVVAHVNTLHTNWKGATTNSRGLCHSDITRYLSDAVTLTPWETAKRNVAANMLTIADVANC